jgi:hypothetical protein
MMNESVSKPENITGLGLIALGTRLAGHSLFTMLDKRNRQIRSDNGVNSGDALFNLKTRSESA